MAAGSDRLHRYATAFELARSRPGRKACYQARAATLAGIMATGMKPFRCTRAHTDEVIDWRRVNKSPMVTPTDTRVSTMQ